MHVWDPSLGRGSSRAASFGVQPPVLWLQCTCGSQVSRQGLLQPRGDHLFPLTARLQAPFLHEDGKCGPGGPLDQWVCHLPPLPAAGAARGPDPLLRQRPLQRVPQGPPLALLPPGLLDPHGLCPPLKEQGCPRQASRKPAGPSKRQREEREPPGPHRLSRAPAPCPSRPWEGPFLGSLLSASEECTS